MAQDFVGSVTQILGSVWLGQCGTSPKRQLLLIEGMPLDESDLSQTYSYVLNHSLDTRYKDRIEIIMCEDLDPPLGWPLGRMQRAFIDAYWIITPTERQLKHPC